MNPDILKVYFEKLLTVLAGILVELQTSNKVKK